MLRGARKIVILLFVSILAACATGPEERAEEAPVEDGATSAGAAEAGQADSGREVTGPESDSPVPDDEASTTGAPATVDETEEASGAPQEAVVPELRFTAPAEREVLRSSELTLSAAVDGDDAAVSRLELELLSGPVLAEQFTLVDASELPEEVRTVYLNTTASGSAEVTLPPGLVDGALYTWRSRATLQDGAVTAWTVAQQTRVSLGLEPPAPDSLKGTIDSTPPLSWQESDEFAAYELRLEDQSGNALGETVAMGSPLAVPEPLPAGVYRFSVRGFRRDGYVTAYSPSSRLRILADASPSPSWPDSGEATFGTSVGLHWAPVTGAASYETELRVAGGEWDDLETTVRAFAAIPSELQAGEQYQWRVRALDETAKTFSWSREASFTVESRESDYIEIVGAGQRAEFLRGYDGGSRDERPVSRITLTRPYEMSRTAMTNAQVVQAVNYALERGLATIDASGVYSLSGDPLIGLAQMDYGQQLGLVADDGALAIARGYEVHPAVGITWLGAVSLANFFSFVEGRAPAYDLENKVWDRESNGYRLPTEAEWEYAARGDSSRLLPWGSSLTGRVANYYRSFDPFEDVNEPFTAAGGPTTPVGYFNGRVQSGFQTVNGSSPFGVLDLVGNTWEWCWDRYDAEYYSASGAVDPDGPAEVDMPDNDSRVVLAVTLDPDQRVVRGTAWNSRATDVRLTNRGRYTERGRSYSIGLRLVRSPQ